MMLSFYFNGNLIGAKFTPPPPPPQRGRTLESCGIIMK